MFRGKQRPQGLEFACCRNCNNGTSDADLVASFMARIHPSKAENTQEVELREFSHLIRTIKKRIPGLLEEMHMGRGSQKIAGKGLPLEVKDYIVRADGPLLTRYMQMFSVKLGQALHFEVTKRIVPPEGGIYIRWYSNVDQLRGKLPDDFLGLMPPDQSLRQGKVHVEDQFRYTSWAADDGSIGAHFASFGFSFAVLALIAIDRHTFEQVQLVGERHHFAPGEILRLPPI